MKKATTVVVCKMNKKRLFFENAL